MPSPLIQLIDKLTDPDRVSRPDRMQTPCIRSYGAARYGREGTERAPIILACRRARPQAPTLAMPCHVFPRPSMTFDTFRRPSPGALDSCGAFRPPSYAREDRVCHKPRFAALVAAPGLPRQCESNALIWTVIDGLTFHRQAFALSQAFLHEAMQVFSLYWSFPISVGWLWSDYQLTRRHSNIHGATQTQTETPHLGDGRKRRLLCK